MSQRSPRWAFMQTFLIPDWEHPERTYLRRLRIVQTPWFGIYLHWIYLPDGDRSPHDHPWPFATWIVRGGYTELLWTDPLNHPGLHFKVNYKRWSWHTMNTRAAHRILSVLPGTITLMLVGPRDRVWGFYTDKGWVDWQTYEETSK